MTTLLREQIQHRIQHQLPSQATIKLMLRMIKQLQQENRCLRKKLGYT